MQTRQESTNHIFAIRCYAYNRALLKDKKAKREVIMKSNSHELLEVTD